MTASPPLLVIGLLALLPACGGAATNVGGTGGAAAGAAGSPGVTGTGGAAGTGETIGDAGVCTPPSVEVGGNEMLFVDVEWCDKAFSCATCTWEFLSSSVGETTVPTSVPCKLPELTCPASSTGYADAGSTSCTASPNAAGIDGALVQLVVGPDRQDSSSLNVPPLGCFAPGYSPAQIDGGAPINAAPCQLGGFRCVPACSACP